MTKTSKSKAATSTDPGVPKATTHPVTEPPAETRGDSNDNVTARDESADAGAIVIQKASSKADQLAAMVVRDEGASLGQMVAALGWLPHTTRAALTGLKKKGYVLSSDKIDGVRTYRAVAPE